MGPQADRAGQVGWMGVFNPPKSHREAIPGPMGEEGKGKEQNHRTKEKAMALLLQKKTRKGVKGMEGKRGGGETVPGQEREVTPIDPTSVTTLVAKARPSLCRSGCMKPTRRGLPGNDPSSRLQQVSYTQLSFHKSMLAAPNQILLLKHFPLLIPPESVLTHLSPLSLS